MQLFIRILSEKNFNHLVNRELGYQKYPNFEGKPDSNFEFLQPDNRENGFFWRLGSKWENVG